MAILRKLFRTGGRWRAPWTEATELGARPPKESCFTDGDSQKVLAARPLLVYNHTADGGGV